MSISRKQLVSALVGVVAVYAALFLGWAIRSQTDSVPAGIDYTPTVASPPGAEVLVSIEVQCNSPLSGSARDSDPLPVLPPQPEGRPEMAFQREPCELQHQQSKALLVIDTIVAVALIGALTAVAVKMRPQHDSRSPARSSRARQRSFAGRLGR